MSQSQKIIDALRLGGFSTDDAGNLVCHREATLRDRYAHERVAVIRIDMARDASKAARDVIAQACAAADEPRALYGTRRDGSALMLFRCDGAPWSFVSYGPHCQPVTEPSDYELAGEQFRLTIASEGQIVRVGDWAWARDRSPLTVHRDALAPLWSDTCAAVVEKLETLGATQLFSEPAWIAEARAERERRDADLRARGIDPRLHDAGLTQVDPGEVGWADGILQGLTYEARRLAGIGR